MFKETLLQETCETNTSQKTRLTIIRCKIFQVKEYIKHSQISFCQVPRQLPGVWGLMLGVAGAEQAWELLHMLGSQVDEGRRGMLACWRGALVDWAWGLVNMLECPG